MENLVLVPEREFREFNNWKSRRGAKDGGILEAIRNPEQRQMVQKWNAAQEIFKDSSKPYELRKAEYDEKMGDFHSLKNKISGFRPNYIPISEKRRMNDDSDKEKSIDDIVDLMPANQKWNARNLMKQIQKNADDNLISWSPTNGEVSIRGKKLEGSNIVDLVDDVMRSSTAKMPKKNNPNRNAFIDALVEMNAPETLIKNKNALKRFQEMKENKALPSAKRARSVGIYHPPGIPERIFKESDSDIDDYDSTDRKSAIDLEKRNASPLSKMKQAIEWTNTR